MAKLKGLLELQKKLNGASVAVNAAVNSAVNEVVNKMIADAKANAPVDLRRLIDSIGKENKDDGWTVVFFVGEVHGAFMEFGTGPQVSIPDEMESEAKKFQGYKGGNFDEFLDEIEAWATRKGIDPEMANLIASKILSRGLAPRPYFYPAYLKHRDEIIPAIKEKLNKLLNEPK